MMRGKTALPRPFRFPGRRLPGAALFLVLAAGVVSCGGNRRQPAEAPTERPLAVEAVRPDQPDVSPDTSFVVFTAAGPEGRDLFRLDTASGGVRALTRSPEAESAPRVSPDGTRVAFLREEGAGHGLWVMNADGSGAARVGGDESPLTGPAWSPDGVQLLVTSAARGFMLAPAAGAEETALAPAGWPAPPGAAEPDWGRDGVIVFSASTEGQRDLFFFNTADPTVLHRITRTSGVECAPRYRDGRLVHVLDDAGRRRLFGLRRDGDGFTAATPLGPEGRDVFSAVPWPHGDQVLMAEGSGWAILARAAAGGEPLVAVPPDAGQVDPVFNADGQDIFYTSDQDGNEDIYVVETEDFTVANLTTGTEPDYQPDYSAATERIVFVTEREGNPDLISIDQSGLDDLFLARDPAADTQPRFSPDGTRIAFVSERAGSPDIWVVDATGGEPVRVTLEDTGAERAPTWVDGGAALVFEADWSGRRALWRVGVEFPAPPAPPPPGPPDTTDAPGADGAPKTDLVETAADQPRVRITSDPVPLAGETPDAESVRPMAAPDGRRVAYTRIAGGDLDLWLLDLETGERSQLVADPRALQDNAAWSGDGTRITYQSGGTVRLALRRAPPSPGAR